MASTPFDAMAAQQTQSTPASVEEDGWNQLAAASDPANVPKPTLGTTTLMTALAQTDPTKDISNQFTQGTIKMAQDLLDARGESTLRNQLATKQINEELTGLNKLRSGQFDNFHMDPNLVKGAEISYNKVLNADTATRAQRSIEEEAVSRIHLMAARDPVQARVLLDNLEKGGPEQTIHDFNVKISILQQRAEELGQEANNEGWGHYLLNRALGLVPTNFNAARAGVVDDGHGLADFFAVGSGLRRQGEQLWGMNMDDFTKFTSQDGEFMKSLRSNATSPLNIMYDPSSAVQILDDIQSNTDHSKTWNNIWGGVEVASAIPIGKVMSATRLLMGAGAAKDAVRNLEAASRLMDEAGPIVAREMTGVTPAEIITEQSVGAISGSKAIVPLSEQTDTYRQAAQNAIKEVMSPINLPLYNSTEELSQAVDKAIEQETAKIGRPVKDVNIETEHLVGGQSVRNVVFTVGKKDGHGFATEGAARNSLKGMGIEGEIFQEVVTTEKTIPEPTLGEKLKSKLADRIDRVFNARRNANEAVDKIDNTSNDIGSYEDHLGPDHSAKIDEAWQNYWNKLDPFTKKKYTNNPDVPGKLYDDFIAAYTEKHVDWGQPYKSVANPNVKIAEGVPSDVAAKDAVNDNARIVRDQSGQWFAKVTRAMPDTGFLVNKLHPPTQGFLSRMFGHVTRDTSKIADAGLHGRALEAGSVVQRAQKIIQGNILGNFGRLPADSRDFIKNVAMVQAKQGRWFKPEELDVLSERTRGRVANELEHDAHSKVRLYDDMDYELRNSQKYYEGVLEGRKTAKFTAPWGEEITKDVRVDHNMTTIPRDRVFDASKNTHYVHETNPMTAKQLAKMKNNGYVMMDFPDGFHAPDGIVTNKVLIKKSDVQIGELQREQLAYAEGGHRMYATNKGQAFIKQGRTGIQPDTGSKYLLAPNTFRTAKNIAEGRTWAETMNKAIADLKADGGLTAQHFDDNVFLNNKLAGEGKSLPFPTGQEFLQSVSDNVINLDHPFEAMYDRELPKLYSEQANFDISRMFSEEEQGLNGYYRTTGRMYDSKKGEILRDTNGELSEILDPYATMSTSLNQVSRANGLFNYKTEALERFKNTYQSYLKDSAGLTPHAMLTDAKIIEGTPIEIKNAIKAQRMAIKNVLGFETEGEKTTRQLYRSVATWVIGDGSSAARNFAHDAVWWWKDKNPVSFIRGMAFDMKLGFFNPGQLLVQSSTMLSALALSPKFAMKGMAGLAPMHAYLLSKGSENVLETFAKRGIGKAMGFETAQEFKDYARHAYRYGFMDMNGSHIQINNYGPAAHFGTFTSGVDQARETSRVFFYTAETWNRLVAYRIAWGETIEKGLKPNHVDFNSTMLKRADDYSFNMTGQSAAFWQKGLLSIPTQFWAYNTRMMDAMLGKGTFTLAQRLRLATAQVGIAGSLGLPGVDALATYIKDKNGASPPIDSIAGAMDRGLIDYVNYQLTGADVKIGERIGTGGWVTQTAAAIFNKGQYGATSMADLVGGATYTIAKQTSTTMWDVARYATWESGDDTGNQDLFKESLTKMLSQVSTFNNANKAYLIHRYGMYKVASGGVQLDGLPPVDAAYTLLSFRPNKAEEISHLMQFDKDYHDNVKQFATQLRNWRQEAFNNPDAVEANARKANALVRLMDPVTAREALKQANATTDKSFYDHLEQKVRNEQALQGNN